MTPDTATWHKSACILCENNCGIQIQTDGRRFAKIRGAKEHVATPADHTLGIIGSGNIGGAVARLAVNAGIDVVLSNSRGPETLRALADRLGPRARAATAAEAARQATGQSWPSPSAPCLTCPRTP
ncbi:NAD(P)-binding domain-containing protein [Streptomyces sp. NPDC054837]